jgi:alpha-L-rhamnosidase
MTCIGTPLTPNWLVSYQGVQEQPIALGGSTASWSVNPYHTGTPAPTGTFRFTRFVAAPGGGNQFDNSSWSFGSLLLQDSEVWGGVSRFDGDTNTATILRNNLFYRGSANSYNTTSTNSLSVSNNLFWSVTSLAFHPVNASLWSVFNNEFDSCSFFFAPGTVTSSGNNAYWNCNKQLSPTNASDITLTNAILYQSGPLGDFYQTNTSRLINAGSCTADLAGLFHYTVITNIVNGAEVPETNGVVDVGLHYLAVDTNGLPLDYDHGGAPNWMENPAGDGHTNNVGEGNWQNGADDVNYLVQPGYLRCEYRVDPWGVDAKDPITGIQKPRLFWILTSGHRAAKQLAYQVVVGTSSNDVYVGIGDMWDSGQVLSDQTIHVEYNGKALQSGQRLWWKVRSWDLSTGLVSPWSTSTNGFFQMGLLYSTNWTAQWLTTTVDPGTNSPMYRHNFVQRTNDIKRATAYVTAKGVYELWLDGQRIGPNLLEPEWTYYNQRIQYQTFDVTANLLSSNTDGTNHAVGAIVAEGWFSGRESSDDPNYPTNPYTNSIGGRKQLLLQLRIERNDGSTTNIVTDNTWSCTISNGPIQGSSIWDGETYAVTNEAKVAGWSTFSYAGDLTVFTNAVTNYAADTTILAAQPSDPIKIVQYLHPIDTWTNTNEFGQFVRIFDMGQNMAGWCSISLVNTSHSAGTQVTVRHAEVLKLDSQKKQAWGNNIDINSLSTLGSAAKQTDTFYIDNSGATQQLQPHFTYHGFRFVEVAVPADIVFDTNSLIGCVVRSAAPETGDFFCTHRDVNQLITNILWTLRANLQGIETDCSQRNERFGWLGDSDAFSQTACFMTDMSAIYTRIIRDIRDGQNVDGYAGTIYFGQYQVNNPLAHKAIGDVGWSAGGVIKPWGLYQNYADIRMLAEHYLSASNWIVFLTNINWPNYRFDNPSAWNGNADVLNGADITFDSFGNSPALMSHPVHNYSFYVHSADLLARMSLALANRASGQGNSSAASIYNGNYAAYTNIAFLVRSNFLRSVSAVPAGLVTYDATGTNVTNIGESGHVGTQGDYAYALYFNMVPDTQRSNCAYLLLNAAGSGIHNYYGGYNDPFTTFQDTNHLSTGIQGTMRAMLELTRNGYTADAYALLLDYRFPSWLHQITNSGAIYSAARTNYGATTSWERWDGLVSRTGGGYHSGYNSFNHFWAGAVGEWIYRNVGGINPDTNAPGYQNTIIEPQPGGGITNALASFNSIHGPIVCSWTNDAVTTNFSVNITVPANVTASVYILGATNLGSIIESGGQATNAPGQLHPATVTNGAALFQVGSGAYQFKAPIRF